MKKMLITKRISTVILEFRNNAKVTKKPIVDIIFNIFFYILSNNNYFLAKIELDKKTNQ